jgi:hypothetical protein
MIKTILLIIGLLILGIVTAYIVTVIVSMAGFATGYMIRKYFLNHTFNPFNKQRNSCQKSGNHTWYAQYKEYLINHSKEFWWTPFWYIENFRQLHRITKYQCYSQTNKRKQECPLNLTPNILKDNTTQPSPECHTDNLAQKNEAKQPKANRTKSINQNLKLEKK